MNPWDFYYQSKYVIDGRTVLMRQMDLERYRTGKRIVISPWTGPRSIKMSIGHLRVGYRWPLSTFAIWSGHCCWQVQTWRPRIAWWRTVNE